jgi:hypothetical protein
MESRRVARDHEVHSYLQVRSQLDVAESGLNLSGCLRWQGEVGCEASTRRRSMVDRLAYPGNFGVEPGNFTKSDERFRTLPVQKRSARTIPKGSSKLSADSPPKSICVILNSSSGEK